MIKVIIAKPKSCNPILSQKSAFLSFPYDQKKVEKIKEFHYRNYEPSTRTWEIEEKNLTTFIKAFPNEQFEIQDLSKKDNTKDVSKMKVQIPDGYNFGQKPYDFQKDGITFGLNHPHFLLADDMGLGKTFQSLHITNILCKKKVLVIVCSASLKNNWFNEVNKFLGDQAYIIGTKIKKKKDGTEKRSIGDGKVKAADFDNLDKISQKYIITNKETLRVNATKKGRSMVFPVAEKINEWCKKGEIEGIIIDEFHLGMIGIKSQVAKALLKIDNCKVKIPMTGTPILNNPLNVYNILKWLKIVDVNWFTFLNTFAELDEWGHPCGYKNVDLLAKKLQDNMLRREKSEYLDLPEKVYVNEILDLPKKQQDLYDVTLHGVVDSMGKVIHSTEPLGVLIELRKCTGYPQLVDPTVKENVKLERTKELMEQIANSNHKAVIFSNFTTVTQMLKTELAQYNPAYITGEISTENRQAEVDKFQKDPNCKVCILSYGAGGQGLTLTAGSYCICYDEPWTHAQKAQAEDRIHRIGQKNQVTIYTLMCKDTIDEKIHDIVENKGMMADYMIDQAGQLNTQSYKNLLGEILNIKF